MINNSCRICLFISVKLYRIFCIIFKRIVDAHTLEQDDMIMVLNTQIGRNHKILEDAFRFKREWETSNKFMDPLRYKEKDKIIITYVPDSEKNRKSMKRKTFRSLHDE